MLLGTFRSITAPDNRLESSIVVINGSWSPTKTRAVTLSSNPVKTLTIIAVSLRGFHAGVRRDNERFGYIVRTTNPVDNGHVHMSPDRVVPSEKRRDSRTEETPKSLEKCWPVIMYFLLLFLLLLFIFKRHPIRVFMIVHRIYVLIELPATSLRNDPQHHSPLQPLSPQNKSTDGAVWVWLLVVLVMFLALFELAIRYWS